MSIESRLGVSYGKSNDTVGRLIRETEKITEQRKRCK